MFIKQPRWPTQTTEMTDTNNRDDNNTSPFSCFHLDFLVLKCLRSLWIETAGRRVFVSSFTLFRRPHRSIKTKKSLPQ